MILTHSDFEVLTEIGRRCAGAQTGRDRDAKIQVFAIDRLAGDV